MSMRWGQSSKGTGLGMLVKSSRFLCPGWAHVRMGGGPGTLLLRVEGQTRGYSTGTEGSLVSHSSLWWGRPVALLTEGLGQAEHLLLMRWKSCLSCGGGSTDQLLTMLLEGKLGTQLPRRHLVRCPFTSGASLSLYQEGIWSGAHSPRGRPDDMFTNIAGHTWHTASESASRSSTVQTN